MKLQRCERVFTCLRAQNTHIHVFVRTLQAHSVIYKQNCEGKLSNRHTQGKASGFFYPRVLGQLSQQDFSTLSRIWSPHTLNRCRCGAPPHTSVIKVKLQNVFCSPECVRVKDEWDCSYLVRAWTVQRWDQSGSER